MPPLRIKSHTWARLRPSFLAICSRASFTSPDTLKPMLESFGVIGRDSKSSALTLCSSMIIIAQQWLSAYFSHRGTEYKMRMNWATSNLIVLITLCGLVSTSAMAYDIKPPQRDGCPPSCGYGSHYYY